MEKNIVMGESIRLNKYTINKPSIKPNNTPPILFNPFNMGGFLIEIENSSKIRDIKAFTIQKN